MQRVSRGELYWANPEEPERQAAGIAHPYLIVQDDIFNHSRLKTVVVCGLTSNLKRLNEPGNLLLEMGEGGLERRSVVVVSQLCTVDKAALGPRIGVLDARRVEQVLSGLRFQERAFLRGRG